MKRTIIIGLILVMPFAKISTQTASVISGTVVGSDDNPMAMANVHIDGPLGHIDVFRSLFKDISYCRTKVNPDGKFKITTTEKGPFYLTFTGVEHQTLQIPLILTGKSNLIINVKLAALKYPDSFNSVQINYNFDEVARGERIDMKHDQNGSYSIQLPTSKKEIVYRITGIIDNMGLATPAATNSDFIYNQDDGFYSTVLKSKNNIVKIIFDPSKLQRSDVSPVVQFANSNSEEAKYFNYYKRFQTFKDKYEKDFKHHFASGGNYSNFLFNYKPFFMEISQDLKTEQFPLLKQELLLECLELISMSNTRNYPSWLCEQAGQIPTTSSAWVYHGDLPLEISSIYPDSAKFIQNMISKPPCKTYAALLLYRLCSYAKDEGKSELYKNLYYRIMSEFKDTPPAATAKQILNPGDSFKIGSLMPKFSFTSVEDTKYTYTNNKFNNKFVLIDFWATWCTSCVGEIKFLESAYEKYGRSGLEMLSVSLDKSREIVDTFRKTRYSMPWKNAYIEKKKQQELLQVYDNFSLPKLVLVNKTGRIVEMDGPLRGDSLEITLSKYIKTNK